MKLFTSLCFLFLLAPAFVLAQQDTILQKEIDRQIWYPFIEAYNNYDAMAFNQLHTGQVIRATPWGIRVGEEYFERNRKGFEKNKKAGSTRAISFTFEYRVHSPERAYEVGYYKVVNRENDAETIHIGQFHVVLVKEDNTWKIAQDWDAGQLNGRDITEEDFMKNAGKGIYQ